MRETDERFVRELMGVRPKEMHKGQCGRVLIAAGSVGMAGAAVLCTRAALRSGAGLVTAAVPAQLFPILQISAPEAMCIDAETITQTDLDRFDAIAVGPGMGVSEEQQGILEHILKNYGGPVTVDADGINNLCRIIDTIGDRRRAEMVLTPHPGEAGRLLKSLGLGTLKELGREGAARILAEECRAVVVLKGSETLVAGPDAPDQESSIINIYVNKTGNPGMACGGSGDVLTGCITALTAFGRARPDAGLEGFSPFDAARCGAFVHGYAGDLAASRFGETGMTSMDIAQALPEAFLKLTGR